MSFGTEAFGGVPLLFACFVTTILDYGLLQTVQVNIRSKQSVTDVM